MQSLSPPAPTNVIPSADEAMEREELAIGKLLDAQVVPKFVDVQMAAVVNERPYPTAISLLPSAVQRMFCQVTFVGRFFDVQATPELVEMTSPGPQIPASTLPFADKATDSQAWDTLFDCQVIPELVEINSKP